MPDIEETSQEVIEDAEEITDAPEDDELEPSDEEEIDPVAALKAEIDGLKAQLEKPAWLNELKTIEGRVRSAEARLQKAEDPSERASLQRDLETRFSQFAKIINSLDETAFVDPSAKAEMQRILAEEEDKAREAALLEKLRSQLPKPEQPQNKPTDWRYEPDVIAWEETTAEFIEDAGFDPNSEEMKKAWLAASVPLMQNRDRKAATKIIRDHIKVLRDERAAARARQQAKKNAGASPKGTGPSVDILNDPNKSRDERAKYLRSLGVQVGPI